MKKWLCILALAALGGCYYPTYAVRRSTPADPPLSKEEVERLATAGVSEGVVGELIDKRGAVGLSTEDLVNLKQAGVPDTMVQKMIANKRETPKVTGVDEVYVYPYYYDYPYSYYYPYPYPYYYPAFSYGFAWGWGGSYCHTGYRGGVGVRVYR